MEFSIGCRPGLDLGSCRYTVIRMGVIFAQDFAYLPVLRKDFAYLVAEMSKIFNFRIPCFHAYFGLILPLSVLRIYS